MTNEESIKNELIKKYSNLEGKIEVKRDRRIFASVSEGDFKDVFSHLKERMNFNCLCMITGLDEGDNLTAIYHLAQMSGITLSLKRSVPKTSPRITSITEYFPGVDIYERELVDMFGFEVEGLHTGNRYPMPDAFPQNEHPLRKDWKPKK